MKVLAADTCTSSESVAFLEDERVVAEWTLSSAETHNRRLLRSIHLLLQEIGWSLGDIDGFAVTMGPGSFTGVRIGLTTIKTLAWTLSKPFIGVPSLDALAVPLATGSLPICTLLDAQKQEVYFGHFLPDGRGGVSLLNSYQVLPAKSVADKIGTPTLFCGNGCTLHRGLFKERLGELFVEAPYPFHLIRAGFVGKIAVSPLLRGESDDPISSVPIYVRQSDAELSFSHPLPS
jgi:tRNA threonylcarbamoyladenosine biosynthesis protein TsaB